MSRVGAFVPCVVEHQSEKKNVSFNDELSVSQVQIFLRLLFFILFHFLLTIILLFFHLIFASLKIEKPKMVNQCNDIYINTYLANQLHISFMIKCYSTK